MSEPKGASAGSGDGGGIAGSAGISRRGLLKGGSAAGIALGVGGWRAASGRAGRTARAVTLRRPGSLPYPALRPGTDTIPQIKHIVVLMMENHSYDNHLGMLGRAGADGFALGTNGLPLAVNRYADGRVQHPPPGSVSAAT